MENIKAVIDMMNLDKSLDKTIKNLGYFGTTEIPKRLLNKQLKKLVQNVTGFVKG